MLPVDEVYHELDNQDYDIFLLRCLISIHIIEILASFSSILSYRNASKPRHGPLWVMDRPHTRPMVIDSPLIVRCI